MNKKGSSLTSVITATLALTLVIPSITVNAESINDLKNKQQELNQKKSELNSHIQEKSNKIDNNESKMDDMMEQISKLDTKILEADKKISNVLGKIDATTSEINLLKTSIADLEQKIDERNQLLQKRARAIQENGGKVSYIDVVLKAKNFADFVDRVSAVNTLLEADRLIIQEQQKDQNKLEEQKGTLEEKLQKQELYRDELHLLRKTLDVQKQDKNLLIDKLENEQSKLKSEKKLLESEYSEALNISKEVEKDIAKEQARLAEVARKQAEAARNSTTTVSNAGETGDIPEVASGTWTKPTNGRLTSGFGWRNIGAGPEFHYGVDLANKEGTPIVAAADGVVFRASPLSTYGNVIMITHSINGHTFTTVYAHLSGYNSKVGQVVKKGQVIGYMGQTGRAYGSHLHFEIHTAAWQGQQVGAVNPLRYISL
ncbi:murein hydrolase activator EnvC family protein [Rummeliibacillus suwonensis]|uniref:murein hydrolase activator EnvC family protein n=1 Tax=Rummeliibacillus suwonensis TaxID=1306154 RepID=UPI001AAF91F1|nr:peptidoglycan DD-metalloendopeptidase family protein [Rummeliibacillus suwonensis]MBO2534295.1 peptidoglycan DD-metalloendopeptidase family protein [Rummeliibacillus suwonensis]